MVYYANHLMNDNMDLAAASILEFIAADIKDDFREKTMKESTKGPTPVAIDAAKRSAAIALFASIEAVATNGINDVSALYDITRSFEAVSDSVALPNGGAVETNLRNELQAANDEVAQVRGQLATIGDRLCKSGFHSHDIVGSVETSLEMLAEARKERDSLGEQLDASEKAREALQAGYDAMVEAHDAMAKAYAERLAELNDMDALLNLAKKWTSYDFEINSRGRRVDVIRALAHRSEVLRSVQDEAAAASLYEGMHGESKEAAISRRNDAQYKKTRSQLAAVIGALVDLMAFWHRGNDAYRRAAGTLESHLKTALGDAYQPLVGQARGPWRKHEASATTRPDDAKDDTVDLASAPFPMNEGTAPGYTRVDLRDELDAAARRNTALGPQFCQLLDIP